MSTYKQKFNKKFKQEKDEPNSKSKMSKLTGIPKSILYDVYDRGVGAYNTNPSSVRPSVRRQGGADRWAYARVNSFLRALSSGKFKGGKHDTDLFPDGHPLKSKGPTDSQGRPKK